MTLIRLVAIALLAVGFGSVQDAAAQTRTLKLGHALAPGSHYGIGANAFAEDLEKRTQGRFKVEQFPSAALGGEREMIEGLQIGTVDLVVTSTGPVGNFVPETLITDIPFLFRNYDHARSVLDGQIGQEILAKFPARGLVALAWWENGFRHLTNSKRAVNAPEDMKGLKVRTMENQVHMTAFRTIGALPTPMAFPELLTALQQGTVDGQENPIPVIVSAKLAQMQKHLTLTGHVYSPALLLMSASVYNALSAADKTAFQDAAKTGQAANRKFVNQVEQNGLAELRAAGMQIIETVDNSKFQAALGPAYAEYAKKFGEANINRIKDAK